VRTHFLPQKVFILTSPPKTKKYWPRVPAKILGINATLTGKLNLCKGQGAKQYYKVVGKPYEAKDKTQSQKLCRCIAH
jgi:hypothetical protein